MYHVWNPKNSSIKRPPLQSLVGQQVENDHHVINQMIQMWLRDLIVLPCVLLMQGRTCRSPNQTFNNGQQDTGVLSNVM